MNELYSVLLLLALVWLIDILLGFRKLRQQVGWRERYLYRHLKRWRPKYERRKHGPGR